MSGDDVDAQGGVQPSDGSGSANGHAAADHRDPTDSLGTLGEMESPDAVEAAEPAVAFGETRAGVPIGGWMLKADPAELGDLDEAGLVWAWPLNPTYRVELMEPGQPVFLWLAEGDGDRSPGLIGAGVVATWTAEDELASLGADGSSTDGADQVACGLWIERLSAPIATEYFAAEEALSGAEVLASPHLSNPLVLTPDEVNAIWDRFDLTTDAPSEEGVHAAELYINEQTQEMLVAVLLPDRQLAMKYDQLDDLYYVISLGEGHEEVAGHGEFDDPLDAVAALVGACEAEARQAAVPEQGPDLRLNIDDHEIVALFPWSEDGVRVIKVGDEAFEVGGEGWDDEAVTTFPTFGEAVLAFAEAAFVEDDDEFDEEAPDA